MLKKIYFTLSCLTIPFLRWYIAKRVKKGKEDPCRLDERRGYSLHRIAKGTHYIWLHGASVGESLALLPFIHHLHTRYPSVHFILTTGTVASAQMLRHNLPPQTLHHYIPLDVKPWVTRFLKHFNPCLAFTTESEIWPVMTLSCKEHGIPFYLINGRISEKSLRNWKKVLPFARLVFSSFSGIFALSHGHKKRFDAIMGRPSSQIIPNLKFAAPPLTAPQKDFVLLSEVLKGRKIIVAASTHKGEEEIFLHTYHRLKSTIPELLLILVPRHMHRIQEVQTLLNEHSFRTCIRSHKTLPDDSTDVFLFDTMGELPLAYHLCHLAIVGGSFVPGIGGHNVIEPGQLGKCTFHGPYMHNAEDVLEHVGEGFVSVDETTLEGALSFYLSQEKNAKDRGNLAKELIQAQKDHLKKLVDLCIPHLGEPMTHGTGKKPKDSSLNDGQNILSTHTHTPLNNADSCTPGSLTSPDSWEFDALPREKKTS